jgi:hypothetical protein
MELVHQESQSPDGLASSRGARNHRSMQPLLRECIVGVPRVEHEGHAALEQLSTYGGAIVIKKRDIENGSRKPCEPSELQKHLACCLL